MNFEKLAVWKRAVRLSADIYTETKCLNDFGFRDQLTRSGLSVPSNIAEGMTRSSRKEKIRFLEIGRSSLAEARTQIYIGETIHYLTKNKAQAWLQETRELSAMITGLINKLKTES
ncbi:four helix bundle protein [Vibrio breoganii]|uniref:four helix bundle protein n=1 Tax=Vibrio breoganii TaxID=553239 RepID=UPI000C86811C|nr:four helix bundle protein [Vibrio breoganii]PMH15404.1 four helix bundle protein [Vibrio breoganii]PMI16119.1 four helix bundle protein [Vibrio breoganii]PMK30212.1 four helix bundle protein [Vibrio breoganii]PMM14661.1 four helix bundle protein [Vibrio breoganii]PMO62231.1 four helix bundle protein [Vibrio breoganii]